MILEERLRQELDKNKTTRYTDRIQKKSK